MLTRYGTDVLIGVAITTIVLVALAIWTDELWARIVLLAVAGFLTVFSLNFFRDPDRTPNTNGKSPEDLIIAPADGKVVLIKEVDEPEYLRSSARLISIFMSPLDVHVNRIPISGRVDHLRYVKGKFLVASTPESVSENERMMIGISSGTRKLLFNQVTGYVARRIVCELKVGDTVKAGERFGMIKFGSRVDIYLPLDAELLIKEGDIAKAGETVVAQWKNAQ
ncbi:MAG: phosphatidylserine decarboxylase family protein [Bacteroidota bacterium]|nr:phosphatidylserine decarboxylase family protein [Bacteroidota bacterium]MDP4230027.1 phosphatidylserine decarboxylase family protein [Bacteroidota bacterium]